MPANSAIAPYGVQYLSVSEEMVYTIFKNSKDTEVKHHALTDLLNLIEAPTEKADKHSQPLFMPGLYSGLKRGDQDHPAEYWAVVVEHDAGKNAANPRQMPFPEACQRAQRANLDVWFYTSFSHTPEEPKWRAVCILSAPIGASVRLGAVEALNAVFDGVVAGESGQLCRCWFVGGFRPGGTYEFKHVEGEPLDLAMLFRDMPAIPIPEKEDEPHEGTSTPLRHRSTWRRVFNEQQSFDDVMEMIGFERCSDTLYSRPGAAAPGVRLIKRKSDLWHSFHETGPIRGTHDAWSAYVDGVHNGDLRAAEEAQRKHHEAAVLAGFNEEPAGPEGRRDRQREENRTMQDEPVSCLQPIMTEAEMIDEFVWISDGSLVGRRSAPKAVLTYRDMQGLLAASTTLVSRPRGEPVPRPTIDRWLRNPRRVSVHTRTFHAGADRLCRDPDGNSAMNTWNPIIRWEAHADVAPFLEHVDYLFPDPTDRGSFLDWLAHLEQCPGELPSYGWLHIAKDHGTGRNWLASLLCRVFRGYVAPHLDLGAFVRSQFTDQIQGRILAIVDEVREGGGENHFRMAEAWKRLSNPEMRNVNMKGGRMFREHNSMRWLIFSNHEDALPIDERDRRLAVAKLTAGPRSPDYYARLYSALADREFVNAVGVWLGKRDIDGFNPGARPAMSTAKRAAIAASKPAMTAAAENMVRTWHKDIVTNADVARELSDGKDSTIMPAMRKAMRDAGAEPGQPTKLHGVTAKVWVLRNHERWSQSSGLERANHMQHSADDPFGGG